MNKSIFIVVIGLILILQSFSCSRSFAQTGFRHLYLITEFAIQQNDTRQFGWPDRLFREPKNTYGTRQFSLGAGINVFNSKRTRVSAGLLISKEVNEFFRPYNLCLLSARINNNNDQLICPLVLNFSEKHSYGLLKFPLNAQGNLIFIPDKFRLYIEFNVQPSIVITKSYRDIYKLVIPTTLWTFDFFSIEFNPGIGFELGHFDLSVYYRWKQQRKDDDIFYESGWFGNSDQINNYNPFKMGVLLKWRLDFEKKMNGG